MKKRLFSWFLICALALGMAVPAFAAYSDLENHWAKSYMEEMAAKGYLRGYDDGTIRPDQDITALEALVLVSRFYTVSTELWPKILEDKQSIVDSVAGTDYTWAKNEMALCLAAGIVTEAELRAMKLGQPIEKEFLTVLLVRAMGREAVAQEMTNATLSFADASQITAARRPYVAWVVSIGLAVGDEQNKFNPRASVTRAVVATMVSRALVYMQNNNITPSLDGYSGTASARGVLEKVSGDEFWLRRENGLLIKCAILAGTEVTVNGVTRKLSSANEGDYAGIVLDNGNLRSLAVTDLAGETWTRGILTSIQTSGSAAGVQLRDAAGNSARYSIPDSASVTQNGKAAGLSGLVRDSYATVRLVNGTVTELSATNEKFSIAGEIAGLSLGSSVTVQLKGEDGALYELEMDLSKLPPMYRGQQKIGIDRIKRGDQVTAEFQNGAVTKLTTQGAEATLEGRITLITENTSWVVWTIRDADNQAHAVQLDPAISCYNGNTEILWSDIRVGDTVSLVMFGDVATEVYIKESSQSSGKLSGTVLSAGSGTITVLSGGKLIYVTVNSSNVYSSKTGSKVAYSAISAETPFVAYGSYSSANAFTATMMVLED